MQRQPIHISPDQQADVYGVAIPRSRIDPEIISARALWVVLALLLVGGFMINRAEQHQEHVVAHVSEGR